MVGLGIVVIITGLCVAFFYLKCPVLTAFATLMAAVFAMIVSLGYYELLAELLIRRDFGGQWAHSSCLILLFVVVFALLRTLSDQIGGSSIDLGTVAANVTAGLTGLLTGLIVSGIVLIGLALSPMSTKLTYSRLGTLSAVNVNSPKKLLINADGLTAGLFSWISKGSLSSSRSFAFCRADFLNQAYLNKHSDIYSIAGKDAIVLPRKNAVRTLELDQKNYVVVRMGLNGSTIKQGGATGPDGKLNFIPGQIRLICTKDQSRDLRGTGRAFYPVGFVTNGKLDARPLGEVITMNRRDVKKMSYGTAIWRDVVFDLPSGMDPVLLEFKRNVMANLPKLVPGSEQVEDYLATGRSPEQDTNE